MSISQQHVTAVLTCNDNGVESHRLRNAFGIGSGRLRREDPELSARYSRDLPSRAQSISKTIEQF